MRIPLPNNTDTVRTRPHRKLEEVLSLEGISFISEMSFPPYQVDVYLPEWHVGIEIDGPWHKKKHDRVRDEYLKVYYGLPIIRFKVSFLRPGWAITHLVPFIEEYADSAIDRRVLWQNRRP